MTKIHRLVTHYLQGILMRLLKKMGYNGLESIGKFGKSAVASGTKNLGRTLYRLGANSIAEGTEEIYATVF